MPDRHGPRGLRSDLRLDHRSRFESSGNSRFDRPGARVARHAARVHATDTRQSRERPRCGRRVSTNEPTGNAEAGRASGNVSSKGDARRRHPRRRKLPDRHRRQDTGRYRILGLRSLSLRHRRDAAARIVNQQPGFCPRPHRKAAPRRLPVVLRSDHRSPQSFAVHRTAPQFVVGHPARRVRSGHAARRAAFFRPQYDPGRTRGRRTSASVRGAFGGALRHRSGRAVAGQPVCDLLSGAQRACNRSSTNSPTRVCESSPHHLRSTDIRSS